MRLWPVCWLSGDEECLIEPRHRNTRGRSDLLLMSHWLPPVTLQIALGVANLSHHTHTYISICYIYIYTHTYKYDEIVWKTRSFVIFHLFCLKSIIILSHQPHTSLLTTPGTLRPPTHNPHVESGWRPTLTRCWFRVGTIIYITLSHDTLILSTYTTSQDYSLLRPIKNSKWTILLSDSPCHYGT